MAKMTQATSPSSDGWTPLKIGLILFPLGILIGLGWALTETPGTTSAVLGVFAGFIGKAIIDGARRSDQSGHRRWRETGELAVILSLLSAEVLVGLFLGFGLKLIRHDVSENVAGSLKSSDFTLHSAEETNDAIRMLTTLYGAYAAELPKLAVQFQEMAEKLNLLQDKTGDGDAVAIDSNLAERLKGIRAILAEQAEKPPSDRPANKNDLEEAVELIDKLLVQE